MEDEDDEDLLEDDWEPTPEQKKYMEQQRKLHQRFPTFSLLAKAMMRHSRHHRLKELGAPAIILERSAADSAEAWDEVCAAFPLQEEDPRRYCLEDVIYTLREELVRPHDSSKTDA